MHTYDELLATVNENEFITAIKMDSRNFYDFLEWQDRYYRTPAGDFDCNHLFHMSGRRHGKLATTLIKQQQASAVERVDSLLPTNRNIKAQWLSPDEQRIGIEGMLDDLKFWNHPDFHISNRSNYFQNGDPFFPSQHKMTHVPNHPLMS